MGGYALGVQQAEDRIGQRRQQRESFDNLQRGFLASQYDNIINAPLPDAKADPKAYQEAVDRKAKALEARQKVYSPDHHASLAEHLHGLITGKLNNGQTPGAPQSTPTPAPSGVPQTNELGATLPPTQAAAPEAPAHPFAHNPAYQGLMDRLKAFKNPEPAKAGPDWQSLATAPSPEQRKGDAAMALQKERDASALAVANARGSSAKPTHIGDTTPKDAIANMKNLGYEYTDENGEPISEAQLSEAPDYMKLVEFRQGNKTFAKLVDQRSKEWNIGGKIYQAGELGKQGPETLSELGQATSTLPRDSVTTQTAPGGGQVVTGTTERSTKPLGVTAQPAAAVKTPGVEPTLKTRTTPTGPVSSKAPKPPSQSGDILPNIQAMTPANAVKATKAQPAVTALMGLFGDPKNPQTKSMADFADLANDPHAQKVLGKAFQLLDQEMGDVDDPGVIATLGRLGGWAGFQAGVASKIQREAGADMTPKEKEYFDTAIASMADIIGSRAATGQSPARFSVKAMQNELPLIGSSSVTDESSYLTKMGTIARQIEVGLNGMPDNGRAKAYLQKRQNDLIQQGNKASKKLNPISSKAPQLHQYAIDSDGKRRKVLDPNAKLPDGWKWE
jgi:hypothetical protein